MDGQFRMPAEWEPHERTLVAWPRRGDLYGALMGAAKRDHAEVVRAIARFEPVTLVAHPDDAAEAGDAVGDAAEVVALPLDDSWLRDTGPIGLVGPSGRTAADFTFNGWGGKFNPHDEDARLAGRIAAHLGIGLRPHPMVLEGGAITVDGEGTLITTEQCLLNPNRNPDMSRADMERVLGAMLGITTVIWLPYGLADDWDTDGHVDNVCAFTAPGRVMLQLQADPGHPDHERMGANLEVLRSARDAAGRLLEVDVVPHCPYVDIGDERRPVPYLNFYVCNDGVVVPVAGEPQDDEVLSRIAACFPGREVVGVPGAVLAFGGGGVHCITQQVPAIGRQLPDPPVEAPPVA